MPTSTPDFEPAEPQAFAALESRIGYVFQDRTLFARALTHSSFGDGRRKPLDNERLEFLGDRVLGLMTAQMLYKDGNGSEGSMARRLNALVRKETCADVARDIDLAAAMFMSKSEDRQGGRSKTSILGDACEALLAAIYLDGGLSAASDFYNTHWHTHIVRVMGKSQKDPKTELQERASTAGLAPPEYVVVSRSGPDHRPEFVISVALGTVGITEALGGSKKEAEREAARKLLEKWNRA